MTIPSLPTDNLYKFCAISGVALIVFGLYLRQSVITKCTELPIALLSRQAVSNVEWDDLKTKSRGFAVDMKELRKEVEALSPEERTKKQDALLGETEAILAKTRSIYDRTLEQNKLNALNEVELNMLETVVKQLDDMVRAAYCLIIFGAGLCIFGFYRWLPIQKAQDKILYNEADLKDEELVERRRLRAEREKPSEITKPG